nr:WAS/WASL-interacting protein family member 1-like [Penaeus vannamei]
MGEGESVEVQHHRGGGGGHAPCGSSGAASSCGRPSTFQAGGGGGRGPLPAAPMSREQLEPFLAALAALQEEQRRGGGGGGGGCSGGGSSGEASDSSSSLDNLSCEVQPPTTPRASLESLQERGVGGASARRATWCSPGGGRGHLHHPSPLHPAPEHPLPPPPPAPSGDRLPFSGAPQVALGPHFVTFQVAGGGAERGAGGGHPAGASTAGRPPPAPHLARRASQFLPPSPAPPHGPPSLPPLKASLDDAAHRGSSHSEGTIGPRLEVT